jgi:lysylphosphatidylglycerol synthetase-like protein (DUF2156 family)
MTNTQLRTRVGLFWVFAHFAILSTIIICFFLQGFEFDEMTTLLAVIIPMFAGTTTIIVRYFATHASDTDAGTSINLPYIVLTTALPVLFTITILATIILRARNQAFATFDQCKLFLTAIEAVYVVYTSVLLAPLFNAKPEDFRQAAREPAPGADHT